MLELNVLYQTDNNYAPQTGVSITSLFQNNKDIEKLNVYVLDNGISEENIKRFETLGDLYHRNIHFLDASDIVAKLKELGVVPYKGSYTTYCKLFTIGNIETANNRILQIDGDTIINSSLADLENIELEDYVCAATYDCVQNKYKSLIGIEETDPYFNCGVLYINQVNWRSLKCYDRIVDHLTNIRAKYLIVDQDIINILFRHKITYLDIKYNLNSGFYLYGINESFFIYDLQQEVFAPKEAIRAAMMSPVINHCMGPMTGRPWEKGNSHPQGKLYDRYLNISPWSDVDKVADRRSTVDKIQFLLYRILPGCLYARIHKSVLKRTLKKLNADLLN